MLESTSGLFWDAGTGWFAYPRGRTVRYLHGDTRQYAVHNGIDFVPDTPPAPSSAPPTVRVMPGTPGAAAEGEEVNVPGAGYIVQRRRGVLLCALCRRRFRRLDTLKQHLAKSKLHAANVSRVKEMGGAGVRSAGKA